MAKKAQAKKAMKKAAKKSPAKAAKKSAKKAAPKKAAKKSSAKSAPKKAAKKAMKAVKKTVKKAVKKAAPKKAIKTAAKSAKKVVKSAAKSTKKAVKSAAKTTKKAVKKVVKKAAAPAKKVVSKAKAVAKKVVKKAAPKKIVKSAPKKSIVSKAKNVITNMKHSVSDFFIEAAVTAIEKIAGPNDESSSEESSKSKKDSNSDKSEKEGGSDEEEEERTFVQHQTNLKVGDLAPFFEGKDQDGQDVNLASFPGKTIILYFYPKDDTPGCTATACSLRDEHKYLGERNYAVVGVSADNQQSHAKFSSKYELDFPLLADVDHKIVNAYGVWGAKQFMGRVNDGIVRTTFVISPNGIIKAVVNKVDTQNHAQQILELEQTS